MKQAKINRDRAKRAELALKAQGYWDCGESYALADLLGDARHLCDREGWDFDEINESGHGHYSAERDPDDLEQSARAMHRKGDYPILPMQMSDAAKVERALALLIEARDLVTSADNKRTVERIKSAISSCRGARRIQGYRETRKQSDALRAN